MVGNYRGIRKRGPELKGIRNYGVQGAGFRGQDLPRCRGLYPEAGPAPFQFPYLLPPEP